MFSLLFSDSPTYLLVFHCYGLEFFLAQIRWPISWPYLFGKDLLSADTFIPVLSQGPHLHPFQQCSWPVHKGLPSSIRRSGQRARKTSQVRARRKALQGVCSTSSEHRDPHKTQYLLYSKIFIIFLLLQYPTCRLKSIHPSCEQCAFRHSVLPAGCSLRHQQTQIHS